MHMGSSKTARLRRRQAARHERDRRARHAPLPAEPQESRPGPDRYAVSRAWSWTALTGAGAASVIALVPAVHHLAVPYSPLPSYWRLQGRQVGADRPDYPHTELSDGSWGGQMTAAGTARTDVVSGELDTWNERVFRERYGDWGRDPYDLEDPEEGLGPVIHNTGQGGSGLALAWGAAHDVAELVSAHGRVVQ